jgi:glutamine amidotransferase
VTTVVVCDYGAGNTRSVRAALSRLGVASQLSHSPDEVADASHVVLPGVGSARSAMEYVRRTGIDGALQQRMADDRPTLGICLGLQLALEYSDEDGGVEMLGLVAGEVHRVRSGRVPRLGWSTVQPGNQTYYFAHSFVCDSPFAVAHAHDDCAIVAAGSFTGVQFHPEKSGPAGLEWMQSWLTPA